MHEEARILKGHVEKEMSDQLPTAPAIPAEVPDVSEKAILHIQLSESLQDSGCHLTASAGETQSKNA